MDRVTKYAYDDAGNLAKLTDPAGGSYEYRYDGADRLTAITTPLGYSRQFEYDAAGNIATETDSLGRSSSYVWDEQHHLVGVTDSSGADSSFSYDISGQLVSAVDPLGAETKYTYDPLGRITKIMDATGAATTAGYDLAGNLVASTDTAGKTTKYSYDPAGRLTQQSDPLGHVTKYGYDANDRLTSVSDPLGGVSRIAYDAVDQVTQVTDPMGAVTSYAYDRAGNLASQTDPSGYSSTFSYDAGSQLTAVTDALGQVSAFTYDELGNVVSVTGADGEETKYSYDAESNLTSVTSPTGAVEKWLYDPAGRLKEAVDAGGMSTTYDYDEVNQLVSESFEAAADESVSWTYDAAGRRVSMADITGDSTYTYDEIGRLTSVTNGQGHKVTYSYHPNGQVGQIGYPDGSKVVYDYDDAGNLTSVTDSAGTSVYTYDEADQVVKLARADGTTTRFSYDQSGQITAVETKDASGELVSSFWYTHDEAGQIISELQIAPVGSDGKVTGREARVREFTYDELSRLASYTDSPAKLAADTATPVALARDPEQALAAPAVAEVGAGETVSYSYDETGNRTQVTRSDRAGTVIEQVDYEYSADDRLLSAKSSLSGTSTYTYSAAGALLSATDPAGETVYEYTAAQRLAAVRSGGRLLMAAAYDGDGNRVFTVESYPVEHSAGFKADTGGDDVEFSWTDDELTDTAGGLFWYGLAQGIAQQFFGTAGVTVVPSMQAIQDTWGAVSVRLPSELDLTDDDVAGLQAAGVDRGDVADWVTRAKVESGQTTIPSAIVSTEGFAYDLTWFVNDVNQRAGGFTQAIAEYGPAGAWKANHTYGAPVVGAASRLSTTDSTGVSWPINDGRGSTTQVMQDSQPVASMMYSPFGIPKNLLADEMPAEMAYGYNSEAYHPSAGLQYLRARYYLPNTGTFLTQDSYLGSMTNPASLNRYAYAWGDPVNQIDPSGHWPWDNAWKAVKKAASDTVRAVSSGFRSAAKWVDRHVVKPVVRTVKRVASWVDRHVIKPVARTIKRAASWLTNKVVKPASRWVRGAATNAVRTFKRVAADTGRGLFEAGRNVKRGFQAAYRSTSEYVQARTAELKTAVVEFSCGAAEHLSNAWEASVDWVVNNKADLIGGAVGFVAGGVVTGACLAGTLGVGSVGCLVAGGAVAGAVGGAVSGGIRYAEETPPEKRDAWGWVSNVGGEALLGGVVGGVFGLAGPAASGIASALRPAGSRLAATGLGRLASSGFSKLASSGVGRAFNSAASAAGKVLTSVERASQKFFSNLFKTGRNSVDDAGRALAKTPKSRPCGFNSFAAGTMVLVATGGIFGATGSAAAAELVAIEDVQLGDRVVATDEETGEQYTSEVTNLIRSGGDHEWVDITLATGETITATDGHPFWLPDEEDWVDAGELDAGDELATTTGTVQITAVDTYVKDAIAYNLTVADLHTYHVGQGSVLVHNDDCHIKQPGEYQVQANQRAGNAKRDQVAAEYPGAQTEKVYKIEYPNPENPAKPIVKIRRADVVTTDKVAIEVKVGRVSASSSVKAQIAKDAEMLRRGMVDRIEWRFARSEVTGKDGPTAKVKLWLENAGIDVVYLDR